MKGTIAIITLFVTLGLLATGRCSPSTAMPTASQARSDGAIRLTTPPGPASDQNPAFSPDGTRLVFTRFDNGYNEGPAGLFLLDLHDTAIITRLTPAEDQDNVNLPGAAWNGVKGRIILSSDRDEADELWRIAPDGSDFTRVTVHTDTTWYSEPSWSPDGEWIVFEVSQPGGSEDGRVGRIWKVRSDGSDPTPLTDGGHDDRQPNWSPSGERILFQRRTLPDGQWDIYTIAPDGSDLQQVTTTASDDTDASWSPGGGCIVYSSDYGGLSVANIYLIPADGGTPARITNDETYDGAPSWSPDGGWIAFESATGGEDSPSALWRIAVPAGACPGEGHAVYLPLVRNARFTALSQR